MDRLTDQDYLEFFTSTSTDKYSDAKLLYDIMGAEAFTSLIQQFGGSHIYMPKFDEMYRFKRNKAIKTLYREQGMSYKEIAVKYDLSVKRVYDILLDK